MKTSLNDTVRQLVADHSIHDILAILLAMDQRKTRIAAKELDISEEVEVEVPGEIDGADQARIDEADAILAAFQNCQHMMNDWRRADVPHQLYMALPYGARDIFHPEQGLKA